MPAAVARPRRQRPAARGPLFALVTLAVVILGLAFGLGMLVGRHQARQPGAPAVAVADVKKPGPPARRGAPEPTTPPAVAPEKLTFYQTLTAPLGAPVPPTPPLAPNGPAAKPPAPRPEPARSQPDLSASMPSAAAPPARPLPASTPPVAPGQPAASRVAEWTVQVGVFKNAQQAEAIGRQLTAGGFDPQVTVTAGEDKQPVYRVRVGAFKARDDAVQLAQRVRTERSLPTFVTTR